MTKETKTWRDAKIPAWVRDSINDDMSDLQLRAALAWPTEAKPEPLPFRWGDYDRLCGEAVEGAFWVVQYNETQRLFIRKNEIMEGLPHWNMEGLPHWKKWKFSSDGEIWTTSVPRCPIFATEHDAWLHLLWSRCEQCASDLRLIRRKAGLP